MSCWVASLGAAKGFPGRIIAADWARLAYLEGLSASA